jgi:hypothetical protein
VYGIVKQNNGFINVYSEPGNGTTFRIYLPRYTGQAVDLKLVRTAEIPQSSGETVLVVEDEPAILAVIKIMLEELGYLVLAAGTPGEAIGLSEEHAGETHLLKVRKASCGSANNDGFFFSDPDSFILSLMILRQYPMHKQYPMDFWINTLFSSNSVI